MGGKCAIRVFRVCLERRSCEIRPISGPHDYVLGHLWAEALPWLEICGKDTGQKVWGDMMRRPVIKRNNDKRLGKLITKMVKELTL